MAPTTNPRASPLGASAPALTKPYDRWDPINFNRTHSAALQATSKANRGETGIRLSALHGAMSTEQERFLTEDAREVLRCDGEENGIDIYIGDALARKDVSRIRIYAVCPDVGRFLEPCLAGDRTESMAPERAKTLELEIKKKEGSLVIKLLVSVKPIVLNLLMEYMEHWVSTPSFRKDEWKVRGHILWYIDLAGLFNLIGVEWHAEKLDQAIFRRMHQLGLHQWQVFHIWKRERDAMGRVSKYVQARAGNIRTFHFAALPPEGLSSLVPETEYSQAQRDKRKGMQDVFPGTMKEAKNFVHGENWKMKKLFANNSTLKEAVYTSKSLKVEPVENPEWYIIIQMHSKGKLKLYYRERVDTTRFPELASQARWEDFK